MKEFLCIDIGGTSIKFAIFSEDGQMVGSMNDVATQQTIGNTEILDTLHSIILDKSMQHIISGVCISTAGVVDTEQGRIQYAGYTIPGYTGTELKAYVEEHFHIPCEVENDVNCACLGEFWKGAGQGSSSMVCLTIGTGVGGAIMSGGHLWHGYSNTAGEIGYMNVNGKKFQDVASTTYLVQEINAVKGLSGDRAWNGYQIFQAAKEGDAQSIEGIQRLVENLVTGLTTIIYLVNPQVIVLGGGIMAQEEMLKPLIEAELRQQIEDPQFLTSQICFAQQKNAAGMLGALYHFIQKQGDD